MSFSFSTTKSIVSGAYSASNIGEYCLRLSIKRALIVTDSGITKLGLHETVIRSLSSNSILCSVFDSVQADPPTKNVNAAVTFAKDKKVDGIIGLGGGSSLDTAKLISVMTNSSQSLNDLIGVDQIRGSRLPLLQVPTTAGTGSEVTPISIVTTDSDEKVGIVSDVLLPDIAVLDPTLSLDLPPSITAYTGIDAMVHAIEAYTSAIKKNPYSDMLARQALSLLSCSIEAAVHYGNDLGARNGMMLGATLAGQAFANAPVGGVHALAYPLGGRFHIPHGLSNSLVLPHVMRFNLPTAAQLYSELSEVIIPHVSLKISDETAKAEALINYLESLIINLNLPKRLRDFGVKNSDLNVLVQDAFQQKRLLVNNPTELNEAGILSIYQAAL